MFRKLLPLIFLLLISTSLKAQFQSDVILTSPNAVWTDARAYSSLNSAIASVGANQRTILIPSPQTVTTLIVPSNITLEFVRDGSITNSDTLTIQTKNIIASNRQIFTGVGAIDFASGTIVQSGWFQNFESALALTNNDTVTLIVSKPQTLTASFAIGNNVQLKWEAPGNILTIDAGKTISNIKSVQAGDYQIFAGAGTFTFVDGINLNLKWFFNLRAALTWINTTLSNLIIPPSYVVDLNDSVPSNINLDFNSLNGCFNVSPGVTLLTSNQKSPINVKNFCAVGDDIADDTAPINNAAASAVAGNNQLYFPKGIYRTDGINLTNGVAQVKVNISAESGYGGTKIRCTGTGPAITGTNVVNSVWENLTIDDVGTCTDGILFTSSAFGNGTHQMNLSNITIGNFTNGAAIHLGESTGEAASEMTFINTKIEHVKYGVQMEAANTGAIWFYGLRIYDADIAVYFIGDANYNGFPVNINGASFSGNDIDFKLENPLTLTVTNLLSEGMGGIEGGRLLELGTLGADSTSLATSRISFDSVQAWHHTYFTDFKAAILYIPAYVTIKNSIIGNGYFLMSGDGTSSRKSRISVENSTLWYKTTPSYYPGGTHPFVFDAGCLSAYFVSMRGIASHSSGTIMFDDQDYIYQTDGTKTTLYEYAWSASAAASSPSPKFPRYQVYGDDTTVTNAAPQYGLGYSNDPVTGGVENYVQLGGYAGVSIVSNGGLIKMNGQGVGRVGVGVEPNAKTGKLQIKSNGATSATDALNITDSADGTLFFVRSDGMLTLKGIAFADLGTPANGNAVYCTNCTIASPCAAGGTGALAKRLNGAWVCN